VIGSKQVIGSDQLRRQSSGQGAAWADQGTFSAYKVVVKHVTVTNHAR
jgi:hypothetical protein